jgi:hypothetical protein
MAGKKLNRGKAIWQSPSYLLALATLISALAELIRALASL